MLTRTLVFVALAALSLASLPAQEASTVRWDSQWLVFEGGKGPGHGKHIVWIAGDDEYRSEEGLPQMAKIMSKHHGFKCTVLFPVEEKTGLVNPQHQTNIPGTHVLKDADLMVLQLRFRDLPDAQMKPIVDYFESGRPIVGLRTSTHAFKARKFKTYQKWTHSKEWPGGFGRHVLGEKWIAHHGHHGKESCRGIVVEKMKDHPILRGITPKSVWDPADVYAVRLPMLPGIQPVLLGQCLAGMQQNSEPLPPAESGKRDKNNPMMPVAWIRIYEHENGKKTRIYNSTMGSAPSFLVEGSRRLLVNACYWTMGMEDAIKPDSNVTLVGDYKPTMFGFKNWKRGRRPAYYR